MYATALKLKHCSAITIAIRYGTVRRQGEIGADGLERQVISYPSLHYRLLPILSHAYVFIKLSDVVVRTLRIVSSLTD
jgi:acyl-CoA oxidase